MVRRVRTWRMRTFVLVASVLVLCIYYLEPWPRMPNAVLFDAIPADGKVHWRPQADSHPVKEALRPLPAGRKAKIPKIQAAKPKETSAEKLVREQRLATVLQSFNHSWTGYKQNAWLRDEVAPISGKFKDTFGGWAATLVDALDSLWIMGMKADFEMAVGAVAQIDFTTTEEEHVNVFETTIRYMGGFLAAYDLSERRYPVLLKKAQEVGELLMSVFDTPNRMPVARWNWKQYMENSGPKNQEAGKATIVSELGSLTLEFTHLSQLTGDLKYYDAVQRISDAFDGSQDTTRLPGMWPIAIDASIPQFDKDNTFTLGGMSDSVYEYLPKQYLLLGGVLEQPRRMYEKFLKIAKEAMFYRPYNPQNLDILISGDIRVQHNGHVELQSSGQHLTCFAGGMVGIASKIFETPEDMEIARALTDGCVWSYDITPSGIGPEIFSTVNCGAYPKTSAGDCKWDDAKYLDGVSAFVRGSGPSEADLSPRQKAKKYAEKNRLPLGMTSIQDPKYILRPEAIESVFIMWRLTGEREWQDKAWRMFEAIERWTKTDIASSAINDVTRGGAGTTLTGTQDVIEPRKTDSMESFWLAETLKYFYLVFADFDLISLDDWVLNTEAHPLKRPS